MTTFTVVVTVDPEGPMPDQLLGAVQAHGIVIEAQLVFEGGEESLSGIEIAIKESDNI